MSIHLPAFMWKVKNKDFRIELKLLAFNEIPDVSHMYAWFTRIWSSFLKAVAYMYITYSAKRNFEVLFFKSVEDLAKYHILNDKFLDMR